MITAYLLPKVAEMSQGDKNQQQVGEDDGSWRIFSAGKTLRDNLAERGDEAGVHDYPINLANQPSPLGWPQFAFLGASLVELVEMFDSIFELTSVSMRK